MVTKKEKGTEKDKDKTEINSKDYDTIRRLVKDSDKMIKNKQIISNV